MIISYIPSPPWTMPAVNEASNIARWAGSLRNVAASEGSSLAVASINLGMSFSAFLAAKFEPNSIRRWRLWTLANVFRSLLIISFAIPFSPSGLTGEARAIFVTRSGIR